jgi:dihydrofolate reductase
MRKLFWQIISSVDGFVEGPDRELDWVVADEDFNRYVVRMLDTIDVILFGRVTYEALASYWPSSTDAAAPRMNGLPKVVFSRTLERVAWQNARLATVEPADEVAALKRRGGKDLALFGSADVASTRRGTA